jgi:hypothetical protein
MSAPSPIDPKPSRVTGKPVDAAGASGGSSTVMRPAVATRRMEVLGSSGGLVAVATGR